VLDEQHSGDDDHECQRCGPDGELADQLGDQVRLGNPDGDHHRRACGNEGRYARGRKVEHSVGDERHDQQDCFPATHRHRSRSCREHRRKDEMELSPRTTPLDEPETHGAEQSVGAGQYDEQSEPQGREASAATTLITAAAVAPMQASETPGVMKRSVGWFMTLLPQVCVWLHLARHVASHGRRMTTR